MTERPVLELDGSELTSSQVALAARGELGVRVGAAGRARATASAELGERIAQTRLLYGRGTGVGANRTVLVAADAGEQNAHAERLLASHASSAGSLRSPERVRAMLVVRLNQLCAGGSGVDPQILDALAAMIAGDVLPAVRELGSIGTGDLTALARVAIELSAGRGRAGEPGHRAPVTFRSPDALAFLSSNAGAIADAALATDVIATCAAAAVAVAALTLEAVDGNLEAFSTGAEGATPFPGAAAVCRAVRSLTAPSHAVRIQDPFALRTFPQTHGPLLESIAAADRVVGRMNGTAAENPLLLPADHGGRPPHRGDQDGLVAHHGGFHATYLHHALAALTLALTQSARGSTARLAMLCEPAFTGQAPFLSDGTLGASGVMTLEYVAASALSVLARCAQPPGVQTAVLSRGAEEDASFAAQSADQALTAAGAYREVLACELVAATRADRARTTGSATSTLTRYAMAPGPRAVRAICRQLPSEVKDRDLTPDLDLAGSLLPRLAAVVAPLLAGP